jgi:hypothetical protein
MEGRGWPNSHWVGSQSAPEGEKSKLQVTEVGRVGATSASAHATGREARCGRFAKVN